MKIKHVTLVTTKLEEMKHFYTKTLALQTLSCDKNSFTLIIGTSLLTFVSGIPRKKEHKWIKC
jgi:catechol-2,3-dioxygenase